MTGARDRDLEADCVVDVAFDDVVVAGCWGGVITCRRRWWWEAAWGCEIGVIGHLGDWRDG